MPPPLRAERWIAAAHDRKAGAAAHQKARRWRKLRRRVAQQIRERLHNGRETRA